MNRLTPLTALALAILFCHSSRAVEPDGAKIFEHHGRDGITNEWYLSLQKVKSSPKWDPLRANPPLSIKRAIEISSKWIAKRMNTTKREPAPGVDSITINSLHSYDEPFAHVFYYRIIFDVGPFDQRACIVLMDGSVLNPQPAGTFEVTQPHFGPYTTNSSSKRIPR